MITVRENVGLSDLGFLTTIGSALVDVGEFAVSSGLLTDALNVGLNIFEARQIASIQEDLLDQQRALQQGQRQQQTQQRQQQEQQAIQTILRQAGAAQPLGPSDDKEQPSSEEGLSPLVLAAIIGGGVLVLGGAAFLLLR